MRVRHTEGPLGGGWHYAASFVVHAVVLCALALAGGGGYRVAAVARHSFSQIEVSLHAPASVIAARPEATPTPIDAGIEKPAAPVKRQKTEPALEPQAPREEVHESVAEAIPAQDAPDVETAPARQELHEPAMVSDDLAAPDRASAVMTLSAGGVQAETAQAETVRAGLSETVGAMPLEAEAVRKIIQDAVEYPFVARKRGIQGVVLAGFAVDGDGRPSGIKVIRSSGSDALDRAVLRAIERSSPYPARRVSLEVPVRFEIR